MNTKRAVDVVRGDVLFLTQRVGRNAYGGAARVDDVSRDALDTTVYFGGLRTMHPGAFDSSGPRQFRHGDEVTAITEGQFTALGTGLANLREALAILAAS